MCLCTPKGVDWRPERWKTEHTGTHKRGLGLAGISSAYRWAWLFTVKQEQHTQALSLASCGSVGFLPPPLRKLALCKSTIAIYTELKDVPTSPQSKPDLHFDPGFHPPPAPRSSAHKSHVHHEVCRESVARSHGLLSAERRRNHIILCMIKRGDHCIRPLCVYPSAYIFRLLVDTNM